MRKATTLLALLIACAARGDVLRKPGLLPDGWYSARGNQYNSRYCSGNVRQLTLTAQTSYEYIPTSASHLGQPIGLLVDWRGDLFVSSYRDGMIAKIDTDTWEQVKLYTYGADAPGNCIPSIWPISVPATGADTALTGLADMLFIYLLRPDGTRTRYLQPHGVDLWGDVTRDAERAYWANQQSVDNPWGPRVCAEKGWPTAPQVLWTFNPLPGHRANVADAAGGIVLWGNTLIYTPRYWYGTAYTGVRYASGIYGIDRVTGGQRWFVSVMPNAGSRPTIYQGRLYTLEDEGAGSRLACRDPADGHLLWSVSGEGNSLNRYPVIAAANGEVTATLGGQLVNVRYDTGRQTWSMPFDRTRIGNCLQSYLVGFGASATLALWQSPNVLLLNAHTGAVLQTIRTTPYTMALAGWQDRLFASAWVPTFPLTYPAQVTMWEDVSWIAPGQAPEVRAQPHAYPWLAGRLIHVSAYVDGSPPLTYQWLRDGVPIAGAPSLPYFEFLGDTTWNGAKLSCRASNPYGITDTKTVVVPALAE